MVEKKRVEKWKEQYERRGKKECTMKTNRSGKIKLNQNRM